MEKEQTQAQEAQQRHQKLLARAVKLLARREHSRGELVQKLVKRGHADAEIAAVLDECEREGWLDDNRFAEIYVRQRKEARYGPVRILAELQQRGIDSEPEILAATAESEWRLSATRLRRKKFGLGRNLDWNERGRQGRFLAQRGFSMSQIDYALEQEDSGTGEDESPLFT